MAKDEKLTGLINELDATNSQVRDYKAGYETLKAGNDQLSEEMGRVKAELGQREEEVVTYQDQLKVSRKLI